MNCSNPANRIDQIPRPTGGRWIWLVADDSEDDFCLLRRASRTAAPTVSLQWVKDGLLAQRYLLGEPPYADRAVFPSPHLLLLDVKMPRCSGFELLQWLRTRPELRQLPVIVFSASNAASDIAAAMELGAVFYMVKPNQPDELRRMLRNLASHHALPPLPADSRQS